MRALASSFVFLGLLLGGGCSGSDDSDGGGDGGSSADGGVVGGAAGLGGAAGSGGGSAGSATGGSATGGSATGGASGGGPCVPATCQGHQYKCGDCQDNDGDGKIDWADPDCFGPCDDNEDGFSGLIPGQTNQPCMHDCYFDQDGGSGNDTCYWDHRCDSLEPETGCAYSASTLVVGPAPPWSCDQALKTQKQSCLDFCGPLVPNGCDCFGCCNVPGAPTPIWLGTGTEGTGAGTCTLADVADPSKCAPCTIVTGCFNDCKHCELCLGKTELPPDCGAGGTGGSAGAGGTGGSCPAPECPSGVQPCGVDCLEPCPAGFYCLTGCCQAVQ
jgi:hypothetical protein